MRRVRTRNFTVSTKELNQWVSIKNKKAQLREQEGFLFVCSMIIYDCSFKSPEYYSSFEVPKIRIGMKFREIQHCD